MKLEEVKLVKSTVDEKVITRFAKACSEFKLIGLWDAFSIGIMAVNYNEDTK